MCHTPGVTGKELFHKLLEGGLLSKWIKMGIVHKTVCTCERIVVEFDFGTGGYYNTLMVCNNDEESILGGYTIRM